MRRSWSRRATAGKGTLACIRENRKQTRAVLHTEFTACEAAYSRKPGSTTSRNATRNRSLAISKIFTSLPARVSLTTGSPEADEDFALQAFQKALEEPRAKAVQQRKAPTTGG